MRPSFGRELSVTHMATVNDEHILFALSDNSLAICSLPSLTLLEYLPGAWLSNGYGEISVLYICESVAPKNFAYIG